MRSEKEIREELQKLYKGRKWRQKNAHLVDMGMKIDGKIYSPKMMLIESASPLRMTIRVSATRSHFLRSIETLEWVLAKHS